MGEKTYYLENALGIGVTVRESEMEDFRKKNEYLKEHKDEISAKNRAKLLEMEEKLKRKN